MMAIRQPLRRAFTLTELMVAVVVLVVIIVGTSRIFGTASRVTGIGQAAADVLQEASAIERQIRADFEQLSTEGFFAIRCVEVPNDYYLATGSGPLINPGLPPTALIRADQIEFFSKGVQSIATSRGNAGTYRHGQGPVSRVYYGHGFQLPEAGAVKLDPGDASYVEARDPVIDLINPLTPWYRGTYPTVLTVFRSDSMTSPPADYTITADSTIEANQPPASQWVLARQAVVLADDGMGGDTLYLLNGPREGGTRSAPFIDSDVVRNGRVDLAAGQLNDIRNAVLFEPTGSRPWLSGSPTPPDQRSVIASAVFYPRAERIAPGPHRVDQSLTNNVLAAACSSFIVDWMYANNTGRIVSRAGVVYDGIRLDPALPVPWFGWDQAGLRGVTTLRDWVVNDTLTDDGDPLYVDNIEGTLIAPTPTGDALQDQGAAVYEAYFGYNRDRPLVEDPALAQFDEPAPFLGYTPWPTAIRITMVLHDPANRLEAGREIQFLIELPR